MRKPKYRNPTPLLLLQLVVTTASAAEGGLFAAPQAADLPATGASGLLQVTIALAVVLAAVFAAAWLMQRLRSFGGGNTGTIKVLTSVALGTRERAVLVQLGKQQLLLGVAPGRVNVLHVLAEAIDTSAVGGQRTADGGQSEVPSFKALMRRSLGLS